MSDKSECLTFSNFKNHKIMVILKYIFTKPIYNQIFSRQVMVSSFWKCLYSELCWIWFPVITKVESVKLFHPPPAESLNFHMKLSNARSYDSKFDKIAVKVNHAQKVKSTKNQEKLNFEKNGFYRSKHILTYF